MKGEAEGRGHLHRRVLEQLRRQPVDARPFAAPGEELAPGDHLVGGAAGEQLAISDIGDVVAALGLVHIMGRDEHGEAARGERVDLVPEGAAGLRIDAGGGLVEQQQLRLVQGGDGEREALLPAAGEGAGELLAPLGEAELVERVASTRSRRRSRPRMRAANWRFSSTVRSS